MSAGLHPPAAADRPAKNREQLEDHLPEHNQAQHHNPIILLSACPRSGSNYLEALLSLHLQCRKSRFPEDMFLANVETLLNFCRSVAESWDDWWSSRLRGPFGLAVHIGEALLRFAAPDPDEEGPVSDCRLMLRSPTTEGIAAATTLFPNAHVVVLVRDGPATVESGRRSFGWPYEEAMLAWRHSVRRILSFLAGVDGRRCLLIRFEDLAADPKFTGRLLIGVAPQVFFGGNGYRAGALKYFRKESPSQRIGQWLSMHLIEPWFAFYNFNYALDTVLKRQPWPERPGTFPSTTSPPPPCSRASASWACAR